MKITFRQYTEMKNKDKLKHAVKINERKTV